jgi:glyoxylate reductase
VEINVKYKVYITSLFPDIVTEMLEGIATTKQWKGEAVLSHAVLKEEIKDAEGLLCLRVDKIDADIINAATNLKVISNFAVGFDNIDIDLATKCGIPVGYTPGVLSETTADLAFALLMAAARRTAEADRYVRNGRWTIARQPFLMYGQDVHHATLGIIGMGQIGAEMARRGQGFRMRVLYCNRNRRKDLEKELGAEYVSLPDLLSYSDFVSIHAPLTESTHHLIGKAELALMKPTAILINTARGQIVDQQALYEALISGKIRGAALDVAEKEPIPPDDPILKLENVVFSPHVGSATKATRDRMAQLAVENLIAGLEGRKLRHCVNPEVFDH